MNNNNFTADRESDIIALCKEVVNMSACTHYNNNGLDESYCPFCYESVFGSNGKMQDITHNQSCAYLIAKDLSTGLI